MADSSKKDVSKEKLPEGNICTAEKIVKDRTYKGVKQYLIKWKSWAPRFNTWEPVENILDPWLLQEYNERQEKAKDKKKAAAERKSAKAATATVDRKRKAPVERVSSIQTATTARQSPRQAKSAKFTDEDDEARHEKEKTDVATSSHTESKDVKTIVTPVKQEKDEKPSLDDLTKPVATVAVKSELKPSIETKIDATAAIKLEPKLEMAVKTEQEMKPIKADEVTATTSVKVEPVVAAKSGDAVAPAAPTDSTTNNNRIDMVNMGGEPNMAASAAAGDKHSTDKSSTGADWSLTEVQRIAGYEALTPPIRPPAPPAHTPIHHADVDVKTQNVIQSNVTGIPPALTTKPPSVIYDPNMNGRE